MEKLVGKNKPLDEQLEIFENILLQNETLKEILVRLQETSLENYYIGAGSINQTIFNYYHDNKLDFGINDYDIVYFDRDTSYEKEDEIIKEVEEKLNGIDAKFDIKNEARVHIWYSEKYHTKKEAYTSVENAVSRWGTTVTCVGVRLEKDKLKVFAPYGLNDIFNMIIKPVKCDSTKEQYDARCKKWKEKWPKLEIVSWDK